MGLLEGAGFSKSNPYFIVQQGKVNALCTMSDEERLSLLKEVAGTTVYDEKKSESLTKMEENKSSIEKINEMLTYIDTRLEELQDEKEELNRYQNLDRERRAVEYTVYDYELRTARQDLDDLVQKRQEEAEYLNKLHEIALSTHDEIRAIETKMKQKTNNLRRNKASLLSLEEVKTEKFTAKSKLEIEVNELIEDLKSRRETKKLSQKKITELHREISRVEKILENEIQPKYEKNKKEVIQLTTQKQEKQQILEGLFAKQNRSHSFNTQKDRDEFILSQIKELEDNLKEKKSLLESNERSIVNLKNTINREEMEQKKKTDDMNKMNLHIDQLTETLDSKKRFRNELAESRREGWRLLDECSEKGAEAREDLRRLQSELRKVTPRATSMGLEALKRIVAEESLENRYFGPIMDNFELIKDVYSTAVEVAAGNALFHVIVDTDSTAAQLMKRLENEQLGRVTFLPLNQLRSENGLEYPSSEDNVTSLLSTCIRYDNHVDLAMKHVFGRKLLARNVEVASHWSQRCKMDAITLDGDLCSSKGSLTGGYVDVGKSRLRIHANLKSAKQIFSNLESEQKKMQAKATSIDQNVSAVMGEMQKFEAKRAALIHALTKVEDEVEMFGQTSADRRKNLTNIESEVVPALNSEINSLVSQITSLTGEIGTELTSSLSAKEKKLMESTKKDMSVLDEEIEIENRKLEEISVERQKLKSLLDDNLMKRKGELEEAIAGTTSKRRRERNIVQTEEELKQRRDDLDNAERETNELEQKLEICRDNDHKMRDELNSLKNELDKLKSKDENNRTALESTTENGEKLLTKRSILIGKRETNIKKIQELGSLPPASELTKYSRLSISKLMKKLDTVNKELKKYSHVNKKAYDQFVNFNDQREGLLNRKKDLDRGAQKVEELVESLDRKKDEAINRTFRGVSSHFKDVFKELVPNGSGELIMRTGLPEDGNPIETSDTNNLDVSLYRGIGIKVRFSSVGENFLMSQLSGGQKALVALALIFSIQRCDPAPFYLFDELDQALDSTYRASVANLIKKQSNSSENPTQFICSTFRPELVNVADRCYGISHQNKVCL